jgi:hypothetical protein
MKDHRDNIDRIGKQIKITKLEDWYGVTKKVVSDIPKINHPGFRKCRFRPPNQNQLQRIYIFNV